MDLIQRLAKAIASAVAAVIGGVALTTATETDGSITNIELPNTEAEWVTFIVSIILGFVLPFLKRNFPTADKAAADFALARARVASGQQAK